MTPSEQVVQQMLAEDMPPLPAGHPRLDGKVYRFGPQKKGWYVAREIVLKSGKVVLSGAFGFFQGENRNTIKFKMDSERMSDVDRAEYVRKQREHEQKEQAEREREIELAANRAKGQWRESSDASIGQLHPYLVKKCVPPYGLRVNERGQLLIPMWSEGGIGARLMGCQKIEASGVKTYNKGMDKIGVGFAYGFDGVATVPVIAIGEGYATCASVHLGTGLPFVSAFDAGNIIHVARAVRAANPASHLLFLADDDYLLLPRFIERLREEFKVSCGAEIAIDGQSHDVIADDGETVTVTAWWRTCSEGMEYIEADMRKGRISRHYTYRNAGVTACGAAARDVGNASVVAPVFEHRDGQKWTDFNDLHVEQSLDAVASQINAAVVAALAPPVPSGTEHGDALFDQAVSVIREQRRVSVSLIQRHLRIGYNRAARLIEQMEGQGIVSVADSAGNRELILTSSPRPTDCEAATLPLDAPAPQLESKKDLSSAAQALQGKNEELIGAARAPHEHNINSGIKSEANIEEGEVGLRSLEWTLDHCSLIIGTTDVWDSLNSLRFKKSAFVGLVGKQTAKEWEGHAQRKTIKMGVQGVVNGSGGAAAAPAAGGGGGAKTKKPKKEYGDDFWDKVERLNDHFALIYGLDEVWDGESRRVLKINPLRLAFGNDAIKFWLNNPARKLIPIDRVMFDPTMKCDPDSTVNLFNGFGMEPKAGEYNLILELLFHLCGEDADVFQWVVSWLAYPLQNPGAKMATSIIMHGDEGSGKNLLFEKCIAKIYGEYGGIIGNAEIESQFNEWASKKLFVVCDEVVTRSELRQLKGRLKAMVSNPTININPKNLTSRSEANHMNFAFLSNELQPLALDKTDRRYMVIWTPPKQTEEYYASVAAQMFNGGNEAFYQFLLDFDVGDFNEHTKPIMTQAKQDLIDLGLSPPERFFKEWEAGILPLPFVCCSSMQLYAAFCRWSYLNGERFPPTQTLFGRTISRIGFGKISKGAVQYELMSDVRQRTVYLVGDKPEGKTREKWVEDGSNLFEKSLHKYRHVFASEEQMDS